jgi:hypothetical protein
MLTALTLSILALSAVGAHHAAPPTPAPARHTDIYSSPAALRHRTAQPTHWISQVSAQPTHWISQVLLPRQ